MTIGTDLEKVQDSAPSLPAKIEYAEELAKSSLLPRSYRQQPANVLIALELGDALGIPAIQAINGIHVIEGKPTASSELIASLVRRAGHKVRVQVSHQHQVVLAQLIRADDPEHTFEARWDMARAQKAGLTGKDVWKKHPIQMLTARAITEVCRMGASDALYGVSHTPDEVTFTVPESGQPQQPRRVTAAAILGQEVVDAEVVDVPAEEAEAVDPQPADVGERYAPADAPYDPAAEPEGWGGRD